MTIKAFECVRRDDAIPITVFGRTLHDAESIYQRWVSEHAEDNLPELAMIFPFGEDRLAARPLLEGAAAKGITGVGYWDMDKGAWLIADPSAALCGDLAPQENSVSYYQVGSDIDDQAMIFAESFHQATQLFVEWHLDRWGEEPEWFSVRKRSRWCLTGDHASLRDGLVAGMTGVARIDNDGVWRILPPDWEPIYGRD